MPVRSLNSSVLRWPDAKTVDTAVRCWAERVVATRPEALRAGYFGSYARGDWGPGSDLDLIVIVDSSDEKFERRAARWDVTELPVPAEIVIYTSEEWQSQSRRGRFYDTVMREAVWVWERAGRGQPSKGDAAR
jgi:predicted nucleotidyltransferase